MPRDELDAPSTSKAKPPPVFRQLDQVVLAQRPELHCVPAGINISQHPFQIQRALFAEFRESGGAPLADLSDIVVGKRKIQPCASQSGELACLAPCRESRREITLSGKTVVGNTSRS